MLWMYGWQSEDSELENTALLRLEWGAVPHGRLRPELAEQGRLPLPPIVVLLTDGCWGSWCSSYYCLLRNTKAKARSSAQFRRNPPCKWTSRSWFEDDSDLLYYCPSGFRLFRFHLKKLLQFQSEPDGEGSPLYEYERPNYVLCLRDQSDETGGRMSNAICRRFLANAVVVAGLISCCCCKKGWRISSADQMRFDPRFKLTAQITSFFIFDSPSPFHFFLFQNDIRRTFFPLLILFHRCAVQPVKKYGRIEYI